MRKISMICCLLLLSLSLGHRMFAQDATQGPDAAKAQEAQLHYYHLVFVVQEVGADLKPVNSRSYSTTVSTDTHNAASIRTGSKVPIATGSFSNGESKALVNTQFQYIDVGVNFDVRDVHEVGRQLTLDLSSDVSSVADSGDPNLHQPVIRQNKWHSMVFMPVGKPTVVFTSDSVDSKGSMQVVVTATSLQ
jgi:hypothetical protein